MAAGDQAFDAERWPKPGEVLVLQVTGVTSAQPATTATIRALALEPWRFEGQRVTLVGQFRGRNLLGDLPASPAKGRYDFVLRSADGSVWVTGLRPRARNVELSVDARVDTGRWVQVAGTVARERGLVMIAGTTFAEAAAPEAPAAATEEPSAPAVPLMPVEVVFSTPTADETDVPATTTVRVQFSRGLNPATLAGQIRVSYSVSLRRHPQRSRREVEHSFDPCGHHLSTTSCAEAAGTAITPMSSLSRRAIFRRSFTSWIGTPRATAVPLLVVVEQREDLEAFLTESRIVRQRQAQITRAHDGHANWRSSPRIWRRWRFSSLT